MGKLPSHVPLHGVAGGSQKRHACTTINKYLEDKKSKKCFTSCCLRLEGKIDESMAEHGVVISITADHWAFCQGDMFCGAGIKKGTCTVGSSPLALD